MRTGAVVVNPAATPADAVALIVELPAVCSPAVRGAVQLDFVDVVAGFEGDEEGVASVVVDEFDGLLASSLKAVVVSGLGLENVEGECVVGMARDAPPRQREDRSYRRAEGCRRERFR